MNKAKCFVVYKGIEIDESKDRPIRRKIEVVPFDESLNYLQGLVDGYIEHFVIDEGLDALYIDMWINEEGKFRNDFKPSFALTNKGQLVDIIMGPCVFSKYDSEGNTLGLSTDEMNIVINWINEQNIGALISKSGNDVPVIMIDAGKVWGSPA